MSSIRTTLYNDISCYHSGLLKVSNIHSIYYEQSGNPNGTSVVYIHGGMFYYVTIIHCDYYTMLLCDYTTILYSISLYYNYTNHFESHTILITYSNQSLIITYNHLL